jgi:D-alanyl-D-alanine carboxypeptidase
MRLRSIAVVFGVIGLIAVSPSARPVVAASPRLFSETGFAIDDPAFLDFFDQRGGISSFGYPVSREFTFLGFPVQVFQRAIFQRYPDGHVQLLNLLDPALFPYTVVNGAILPAADSRLTQRAPTVGSADYGSRILDWLQSVSPDEWNGRPVGFRRTFLGTVSPSFIPKGQASAGFDLEVWGLPTSNPAFDPNNHGVVYQRFQRGIMQYDLTCGCTHGLLLADYFKGILLGANLPPDLRAAARDSPYFGAYQPTRPAWIAQSSLVPNSDLTHAFDPIVAVTPATVNGAPVRVGAANPPNVDATSIAVVDERSGTLLFGRDPHRPLPPASVTKIFTALVALKNGNLHQNVTVQFDQSELSDSTLMGIKPGETHTLEDLLYGLMLPSGNDAALAIANAVGGSESRFVSLMNALASQLGLTDSHFVNPHGLDAPRHLTSAYDLAMATRYGMTHFSEFQRLANARSWDVNGSRNFTVYNLNRFLWSYSGADGVKIGYTDAAGKTIVASATRNGHRVYVVLLHCGDIVADSAPLFDWVFANFSWPTS